MRRLVPALALVLLTACAPSDGPGVARPGPDPEFLDAWSETYRFRLGRPRRVRIAPDGTQAFFVRTEPRGFRGDLYAVSLEDGEERLLLRADDLLGGGEEILSPEEQARRERLRMSMRGIPDYRVSRDGGKVLVWPAGEVWVHDVAGGTTRAYPSEAGPAIDPRFSPDGSRFACVRDGELRVTDLETGVERRLTEKDGEEISYGTPEHVASEEMDRDRGFWWSPDGRRIAVQRTDESKVERLWIPDAADPGRAPRSWRYPRAGGANADVQLGIVDVEDGSMRWVRWERDRYPYLARVVWSPHGPLTILVQDRRQQEMRLLAVDAESGSSDTLLVERDAAWVNLDPTVPRWLPGGDGFLWSSEREGAWRLEIRNGDGTPARWLTAAGLGYRKLLGVDPAAGEAFVLASREPDESHVWAVPLGDGTPRRLTAEPGDHGADFAVEGAYWVHRECGPDRGTRWLVRNGDSEPLAELRSVAEVPASEPEVEFATVGSREYRAAIVRPRHIREGRKYPVLVYVYGGPNARTVVRRLEPHRQAQFLADHGYVVVRLDGRGTPGRGREWERAIHGNLVDVPLEDQVAGLKALGERFPEMDLERVGIFGWSFGGYLAAMAVMRRPDVYHAAFAGAPVADWRDYDTHYTERFLGVPEENEEGYRVSNVLTWAPKLERPLLIAHGTRDDNVYLVHSLRLADVLLRSGRPFELVPLAGQTHSLRDGELARELQKRILAFFGEHLAPGS